MFSKFFLQKGDTVANIKSAKKRNITNEKRRAKNSQVKSSIRTLSKKVLKALSSKEISPEEIQQIHKDFTKTIDTAAGKRIVHKKTAARKKSRIAKKINALFSKPAES